MNFPTGVPTPDGGVVAPPQPQSVVPPAPVGQTPDPMQAAPVEDVEDDMPGFGTPPPNLDAVPAAAQMVQPATAQPVPQAQPGAVPQAPGQPVPATAQPFNPNQLQDWTRVTPDQVPPEYQPLAATAQALNASYQAQLAEVQNMRAQAEQHLQSVQAATAGIPQQPTPAGAQPTNGQPTTTALAAPGQEAVQLLANYGYSPQQEGWNEAMTVYNVSKHLAAQEVQAATAEIASLKQEIATLSQNMQNVSGTLETQRSTTIDSEVQEARAKYGVLLDRYSDGILDYHGKVNPATGRPHTVMSAFEYAAGIAGQQSQQIQNTEQQVISAQQAAAGPVPVAAPVQQFVAPGGAMSPQQAETAIAQIPGFTQ